MKKLRTIIMTGLIAGLSIFSSCHYLDIVPDNVATLDNAFALRSQAEKFLFTCYSYLPLYGNMSDNPGLLTGDEIWFFYPYANAYYGKPSSVWEVARGNQNVINPYLNYWDGERGGKPLFQAIRDCNTFLANIDHVPDMEEEEKIRWKAEAKFLKAYYHWFLLRMYGPIPIIDENKPVSAGVSEVKVYRQPVDSVFAYIVDLIDEAAADLPDIIQDRIDELGRITRPVALSLKARILINEASPLFNGNTAYSNFVDNRGIQLFNQTYDPKKWQKAAEACKEAIELCHSVGVKLYEFNPAVNTYNIGPELQTQMDIRNAICDKWNSEVIWAATNGGWVKSIQQWAQPDIDPDADVTSNGDSRAYGEYAPTMRIAEQFYTKNGVPIDEDISWDYMNRYKLDTAAQSDSLYIEPGYVTASLNFGREPRFYADLGFDGGMWYGQGKYDESDMWHVEGRLGQYSGKGSLGEHSITGYYTKKMVNFLNVTQPANGKYQIQPYPFPIIRLADLYLYYAEALNEDNRSAEALQWINKVRDRAGIPTVQDSWTNYSRNPNKYKSKDGLRAIIHQERLIEMAFEGNRFWDLRRWKEAEKTLNEPIRGWSIDNSDPQAYYQVMNLYKRTYKRRDYFWPIKEQDIIVNKNLVQNPGW